MGSMMISSFIIFGALMGLTALWTAWTSRKKFVKSREKSSPFECGFDPKDKARMPFSLRFFLMVMLFLMFDVEISILLQLPYQLDFEHFKGRVGIIMFVWMLLLGTLEEWRRGVLNWKS